MNEKLWNGFSYDKNQPERAGLIAHTVVPVAALIAVAAMFTPVLRAALTEASGSRAVASSALFHVRAARAVEEALAPFALASGTVHVTQRGAGSSRSRIVLWGVPPGAAGSRAPAERSSVTLSSGEGLLHIASEEAESSLRVGNPRLSLWPIRLRAEHEAVVAVVLKSDFAESIIPIGRIHREAR